MSLEGTEALDRATIKDFRSDCDAWLTADICGALERVDQIYEDLSKARDQIKCLPRARQICLLLGGLIRGKGNPDGDDLARAWAIAQELLREIPEAPRVPR